MDIENCKLETVPTSKLKLDPENPRFLHLALKGGKALSQDDLIREIGDENETITLGKAIQREGVLNPIVVKLDAGQFLVIDGNRRTVALKQLVEEKAKAPDGVRFDRVQARIIPESTSAVEVEVLKGVLQEGQLPWGRFNDAAYVRRLRLVYKMEYEDIADKLQLSVSDVKSKIEDFRLFEQYSKHTKDTDPSRFSYFGDAPKAVREWFKESDQNLQSYFDLICPGTPRHKIRSVATKGGLRDFATVLKDEEALQALLNDPSVTMENALQIAEDNDITLSAPILTRLGIYAAKLRALEPGQVESLKTQAKLRIDIEKMRDACQQLLDRLK
jgi:ParB-like nuclease family protein